MERGERDEPDPVGKLPDQLCRGLQRQPRLSRAAGPGERHETVRAQKFEHLDQLALAADQGRRLNRKVGLIEALERWVLAVTELVDAFGGRQILELVLTEIAQLDRRVQELARRQGDEHLPAVTSGCDPGGAVDVDADVALAGEERLAGMESHPDVDRAAPERLLTLGRRLDRIGRAREHDEECVALRAELGAVVAGESLTEDTTVFRQRLRIGIAELVQQLRRSLDVREEEGDCAAR